MGNKNIHKMKKILMTLACAAVSLPALAESVTMTSPDGKGVLTVKDDTGRIEYSISWEGKTIVQPSALGLEVGRPLLDGLNIGEVRALGRHDETWRPVYGEREEIPDVYNSWEFDVNSGDKKAFTLIVRAYDEGMAFRYRIYGGYFKVTDEYTEYTLPEGTLAYFTPRAQTEYSVLPLRDWPGDGESDRPLLLKLPDGSFACLGEAGVVDYVRTKFKLSPDKPNTIRASMYGPVEDVAPYDAPWRFVMYGEKAGEILEHNYLLYNLNPPCAIKNPTWIKPGKVMREVTLTTEGGRNVVDFAEKHNLQYVLFDAGWYGFEYDKASDATTVTLDLQAVIDYARSKGIGVLLYVNQRALQQQLDEILPLFKSWGVAGVKFGFVQVGSQVWTRWMHEAVRKCAEYGLMVDIHDEYRPTGVSRTWPNLMTQEGVRGNEEFPDAFNNTMLPFTRYVAGPADYTICYYRQDFGKLGADEDAHGVPRSKTIKTTPAHQLALAAIYYSPLQLLYWYDKPSDSQDEPELKFFDDVYTVWDESKVLEGEPGEYVTMARRQGDEWFIGTITNAGRQAEVSLDFLPEGKFVAEIYTDGDKSIPTRTKVRVSKYLVSSGDTLRFSLRDSGGAAVRIVPVAGSSENIKKYKNQAL